VTSTASDDATTPAVTVTTVLHNSVDSLPRYVETIRPALDRGLVRIVAVDNASPDDSVALLKRLLPGVEVVANPTNMGFAAGCDRAWPLVQTRYWLLLNPDVEADERGLASLIRWMDERPDIGAASPLLRGPNGRTVEVARTHDSLWRPIVEALRLHKLLPQRLRSRWLLAGRRGTPERIQGWVPAAALIARRDAVAETGLLREDLFMYGEDREWCWRMRQGGWAIGVCPQVEFAHGGGRSAAKTWGEEEQVRREVGGHLRVTRMMHGRAWAAIFALLTGVALRMESLDPRRDEATRVECRVRGRQYLASVREPAGQ
jgi:GT2 family glycosyltransferase